MCSCGGGGGGGDGFGDLDADVTRAAEVNVSINPPEIGVGDRTLVRIFIDEVHRNGVIIKTRYPAEMQYVVETSRLYVDGDVLNVDPIVRNAVADGKSYTVYYFDRSTFGSANTGELRFHLRALSAVTEGTVEVDTDIHDLLKSPSKEFSIKTPLFSAKDRSNVRVFQ